jgi:hypothetical protein
MNAKMLLEIAMFFEAARRRRWALRDDLAVRNGG